MEPCIYLQLKRLTKAVRHLSQEISDMSETLDQLTHRVTMIEDVGDAAIVLLNGLKTQLDAAIATNDPTALAALSDRLGNQAGEIAAAITANTPVVA